jgi:integrase
VKRIERSPFLFTTTGRTPVSNWARVKDRLDKLMLDFAREEHGEDAKIAPFVIHDLRRTCATGMASLGVAPHIVEAALNHVSGAKAGVAGTYNVESYAIQKETAYRKWAEHLSRVVTGETGKVVTMPGRARS